MLSCRFLLSLTARLTTDGSFSSLQASSFSSSVSRSTLSTAPRSCPPASSNACALYRNGHALRRKMPSLAYSRPPRITTSASASWSSPPGDRQFTTARFRRRVAGLPRALRLVSGTARDKARDAVAAPSNVRCLFPTSYIFPKCWLLSAVLSKQTNTK